MKLLPRLVSWRPGLAPSRTRHPIDRRVPYRVSRPRVERLEDRLTLTTLPPGFTEASVVSGLSSPTTMEFAPDGRLFVLEQGGNVKLVHNDGTTWTALHLNVDSSGERACSASPSTPITTRTISSTCTTPTPMPAAHHGPPANITRSAVSPSMTPTLNSRRSLAKHPSLT